MSERLPEQNPERFERREALSSPENNEQIKSLEKKAEKEAAKHDERLDEAREKVDKLAKHQENPYQHTEKESHAFSPAARGKQKKLAFKQTMKHTQAELKPASRVFSKVIHQPVIEKASDIAAKTVFRPSITLGAALGAFLGGTMFYGFARYYGFDLSGTEFIFSAIVGAVVGLVWEFGGYFAKKLTSKS